jgi:hypothetical protein
MQPGSVSGGSEARGENCPKGADCGPQGGGLLSETRFVTGLVAASKSQTLRYWAALLALIRVAEDKTIFPLRDPFEDRVAVSHSRREFGRGSLSRIN